MSGVVVISVERDGVTGGLQLSIGDDDSGFRLAGPKFNGTSKPVLTHKLTNERDLDEIEAYCKRARAAISKATGEPS